MRPADKIKHSIGKLRLNASADLDNRIDSEISKTLIEQKKTTPAATQPNIWRIIMKGKLTKLAAAAVIVIIVLGGIELLSDGNGEHQKWWHSSSKVWAQEVLSQLEDINAVTCREQTFWLGSDGTREPSMTWNIFYVSQDSYRSDIYDGNELREIQWYIPDGNDMIQTGMRFDLKCYGSERHKGSFGRNDPVHRIRHFVRVVKKTQERKFLGEKVIEDYNCVGFEIPSLVSGDIPNEWVSRIWFDVDTKLPVRIEHEMPCPRGHNQTTFLPHVRTLDQFEYDLELPGDTFIPQNPPEDFVYGHPDDIKGMRDTEQEQ